MSSGDVHQPEKPLQLRWLALLGIVVFLATMASFVQSMEARGVLFAPPTNGGDEDDYERLGYNLTAGAGFGYCPQDAPVLAGLAEPPAVKRCEPCCSACEFMPTAYRPPGFPLLIAAVYRISPLNFTAVRLINCVCCAAAAAWVAVVFARNMSLAAGIAAGGLCSIDPRLREFAGTFLTENLATLILSLFATATAAFLSLPKSRAAFLCGIALSTLVFIRSFYVTWYPIFWLVVALTLFLQAHRTSSGSGSAVRVFSVFAFASLLLTGPWWIRNCVQLQAVMPTGTQGGIGIADGFSDTAYENHGSWTATTANGIADDMRRDPALKNLSGLEFEKEHCRRGAAQAWQWIRSHPSQLPMLTWWKLSRLWECGSLLHTIFFLCVFLGMFTTRSHMLTQVVFLLLLLNSLTVMATYHTYERFMNPFRPLMHGFAGYGVEWLVLQTWSQIRYRNNSGGN